MCISIYIYIYVCIFPKLALAIGVLTVLYKGPWFLRGYVPPVDAQYMLVKMRLESSEVQIPLVKVTKERSPCQKGCKNQYKMALPSLSGLLELWLPWLSPGCLLGASWEPSGSLLGAFWEPSGSPGCPLGASWEPPGCLLGAFWA